jgi:hypothetical protein
MKKTSWFPDHVKPAREGLYQTRLPYVPSMTWSVWKDGSWHYASTSAAESVRKARHGCRSFWQVREWRGLQGDEHSLQIGSSMYLVEFSEEPDRPGEDE